MYTYVCMMYVYACVCVRAMLRGCNREYGGSVCDGVCVRVGALATNPFEIIVFVFSPLVPSDVSPLL